MKSATTFLMFQGQAHEAIEQYQQWFIDIEVIKVEYMENSQRVAMAILQLKELKLMVNDSVIHHKFSFTPSTSIFLECESEEEIKNLVTQIVESGQALMLLIGFQSNLRGFRIVLASPGSYRIIENRIRP